MAGCRWIPACLCSQDDGFSPDLLIFGNGQPAVGEFEQRTLAEPYMQPVRRGECYSAQINLEAAVPVVISNQHKIGAVRLSSKCETLVSLINKSNSTEPIKLA